VAARAENHLSISPREASVVAALGVGLILAGAPRRAAAQQFLTDSAEFAGARLTVTRAPGALDCPDAVRVTEALRPLDIVRTREDALEVHIELRPTEDGFAALITVSGEHSGMRDLRSPGPGCAKLEADLTATLAARPSPKPIEAPHSTFTWRVEAGAGAAILLVGTPTPALAGSFWADTERLSAAATVFSTADQASTLGPGTVDVRLTGGTLRGCLLLLGARTRWNGRLCAAAALAALRGEATGYVTTTATRYRPWYAVGTGVVVGGRFDRRFGWFVDGTALAPLHRESFSVTPLGTAFQTPYAGIFANLGVSMSID
jgi:hypothetical protein